MTDNGDRMIDEGGPVAPVAEATGILEPYEVFRQEKDGEPMRHGGNVMAPDAELALHYASQARACLDGAARRDELEALTQAVVERST